MDYLDFAIEVHAHRADHYVVAVRSPAGEARTTAPFPFTDAALESHLLKLENAILRSAGRRRKAPTPKRRWCRGLAATFLAFCCATNCSAVSAPVNNWLTISKRACASN